MELQDVLGLALIFFVAYFFFPYDEDEIKDLKQMMAEKFTFFWRGVFSQWHPCKFVIDTMTFNCAEQWMMYSKAKLFNDTETIAAIMATDDPKTQKRLGRQVKNFDINAWNEVAKDIVYAGNYAKFTQNPELLRALMGTRGTTLVEASPYDKVWGIGLAEDDPLAQDRKTWKGTNWLGEVLTKVREDIVSGK